MKRKLLLLKAVLLLRKVNRFQSKEEQIAEYDKYLSDEELQYYIDHYYDPEPEFDDGYDKYLAMRDQEEYERYCPSSTAGDYGPGNPWDAPGMSIRDFI